MRAVAITQLYALEPVARTAIRSEISTRDLRITLSGQKTLLVNATRQSVGSGISGFLCVCVDFFL